MTIAFDIETGELPESELLRLYDPPEKPGEFDPAAVDIGRAKKQETIDAKIADAHREHSHMLDNWDDYIVGHQTGWLEKTREKAALDPLTGRGLAIGYQASDDEQPSVIGSGDEAEDLEAFWCLYESARDNYTTMAGHNIFGFELLDVSIPDSAYTIRGGRLYFDTLFVDTMTIWTMGAYNEFVKLDTLAKAFGVEGKLEGVSGADFHTLWFGTAEEHAKAIAYLEQDVRVTMRVAELMGIV